ncbi:MAG TPA: hypothetical protein VFU71_03635 [Burkholderiaceae bacterium]|nr:hypothetical protein [Burkholderiaceae bacterium]
MRALTYGLSIVAVIALVTVAMAAENAPAAAPATTASKSTQCGNMKRHDHAAERGAHKPQSADCPAAAASASEPLHDHRAVHK